MMLPDQVERMIQTERLIDEGETVVVAVSGGPDSVSLLHILHTLAPAWRWKLVVAHVNHMFRGAESDWEAEFVAELSAGMGWPCEIARIDVTAYIMKHGLNAQEAAREKRYAFLCDVAARCGARKIALAHHADDQAETVLMRLIRGAGPAGLAGIPIRRTVDGVELVRPLLRIYKEEIEDYCRTRGLRYCYDSSNEDRKYYRNQIRLDVMPMLRQYNDRLPHSLNRLSETMRAENDYLDAEAARVFDLHVSECDGGYAFNRKAWSALHVALQRRMIKLILSYLSSDRDLQDFAMIEQVRGSVLQEDKPSLYSDLPGNVRFIREYDRIRLVSFAVRPDNAYQFVIGQSEIVRDGGVALPLSANGDELHILMDEERSSSSIRSRFEACFDLDQLTFPLVVRNRKPGDRMFPLGLNGSKKVKDMFIDAKVPPSWRNRLPVLEDGEGRILWIPGLRRSKFALVEASTTRIIYMKLYTKEIL